MVKLEEVNDLELKFYTTRMLFCLDGYDVTVQVQSIRRLMHRYLKVTLRC